jgi:hypothetical protein
MAKFIFTIETNDGEVVDKAQESIWLIIDGLKARYGDLDDLNKSDDPDSAVRAILFEEA